MFFSVAKGHECRSFDLEGSTAPSSASFYKWGILGPGSCEWLGRFSAGHGQRCTFSRPLPPVPADFTIMTLFCLLEAWTIFLAGEDWPGHGTGSVKCLPMKIHENLKSRW